MSNEYTSRRLEVRRPPLILCIVQIGAGLVMLVLILVSLIYNYSILTESYQFAADLIGEPIYTEYTTEEDLVMLSIITLGLFALIYVIALLRFSVMGLKFVFSGISEIVTPWMPANIPAGYRDYGEVVKGFKEHTLSIYKPLDSFISGLFGANSMFAAPSRRNIVEENSQKLRSRPRKLILTVVCAAGIFFIVNWFSSPPGQEFLWELDLLNEFDQAAGTLIQTGIGPFILILLMEAALAIIEYVTTLSLIPRRQPSTIADESSEHYRGFGHPDQIFARLPDLAKPLEWEDFMHRVDTSWDERASAAVGDVGEFNGRIFIEQQPRPTESKNDIPASLMLIIGWLFTLFGLYLFLFRLLPPSIREGDAELLFTRLYILAIALSASIATRSGERFLRYTRSLLEAAQFSSTGILIQIRGVLSRADVKVGKSIADSIESSSVVVRSDFSARFWAAEMTSEAVRLDAERDLLALEQSSESRSWIEFFRNEIETLRGEGVRPIGVDLESTDVDQIMRANISASALRSSAIEQAQLEASVTGEEAPLLIESHEDDNPTDEEPEAEAPVSPEGEYKECPDCAEMVRVRARKCRFCGYRFDEE
ncbi:MAG: hypothetical protein GTO18_22250 [Anaerolineales bacterium]|nr:hypothetical protein [Anaerolineales bacterium]